MTIQGHPFTFRTCTQDIEVVKEVMWDNMYRLPRNLQGKRVLDLGAHIGCFSIECLRRGARPLLAVEACRENWEMLISNLSGLDGKRTLRAAVWEDADTHLSFHSEGVFTASGIVQPGVVDELVNGRTLDSFIDSMEGSVDLLKMDVEGVEWPVLYKTKSLDRIQNLVVELHYDEARSGQWSGLECTPEAMSRHLRDAGFQTYWEPGLAANQGLLFARKNDDVWGDLAFEQ